MGFNERASHRRVQSYNNYELATNILNFPPTLYRSQYGVLNPNSILNPFIFYPMTNKHLLFEWTCHLLNKQLYSEIGCDYMITILLTSKGISVTQVQTHPNQAYQILTNYDPPRTGKSIYQQTPFKSKH